MLTYLYSYQAEDGELKTARIKAVSIIQARAQLTRQHIFPLSVREDAGTGLAQIFYRKPKVTDDDIVMFSQIFASTIRSGLTIKDALGLLSVQFDNRILKNRLSEILVDLEGGVSLSQAFEKHVDVFPEFYPMLIKTGEVSGDISGVLEYIGNYLERVQTLRKELIALVTYPAIVLSLSVLLVGLILWRVAPQFVSVFQSANIDLPLVTRALFYCSDVIRESGLVLALGFLLVLLLINRVKTMDWFVYWVDKWLFRIPLLGPVLKGSMLIRFLHAFDILVNNNVPILKALTVLERATSHVLMKQTIAQMSYSVAKGGSLAAPLIDNPSIVSPIVAHVIAMGEKTGNLGASLQRLSGFVDKELQFAMKKLSARVDPLLTFGLGLIVLVIALAIYLPIFDMMSAAGV